MDISVIVPLYNEEESLPELHAWIKRVMDEKKFSYEIIFVNDGSTDKSWQVIEDLSSKNPEVHGIKFRRNMTWLVVIRKKGMTRSQRPFQQSCLTQQPVR